MFTLKNVTRLCNAIQDKNDINFSLLNKFYPNSILVW